MTRDNLFEEVGLFDIMTDWEKMNPGDQKYICEYCGIYTASKPRCNKCEKCD